MRKALIGCMMWLIPVLCMGQDPFFTVIDGTQGLPSKNVYSLLQDKKGFIWAATDQGLSRYDGHSFKTYATAHQSSRSGSNLVEDKYGRIWYQNFDGYCYYVWNDSLHALAQDSAFGYVRAGALGDYWMVPRGSGIELFDLKTLYKYPTYRLRHGTIFVAEFGTATCWLQSEDELLSLTDKGEAKHYPRTKLQKVHTSPTADWDGVGVAVNYGDGSDTIFEIDGDIMRPLAAGLFDGVLQQVEVQGSKLWVAAPLGLRYVEKKEDDVFVSPIYFQDHSISSMLVDREGNHWFGTLGEGILFVQDFAAPFVPSPAGAVMHVCATPQGLCMGTRKGELLMLPARAHAMEPYYAFEGGHAIDFLTYDTARGLLMVGNPVLTIMDQLRPIRQSPKIAVKDLAEIPGWGYAYAASSMSGLLHLLGDPLNATQRWEKNWKLHHNVIDSSISDVVSGRGRTVAYASCSGQVLFGTSSGLFISDGHHQAEIQYQGRRFFAAEIESYGERLLLRSTAGEVMWWDCDQGLQPVQGLAPMGTISAIRVAGLDIFLLASSGLHRLRAEGNRLVSLRTLLQLDPLLVNDFTLWNDQLAIATDEGILLVPLHQDRPVPRPQFQLTGLRIHGQRHDFATAASVAANENDVEITYAVPTFGAGVHYPVYFRINGGAWEVTDPGASTLRFASLAPDAYRIEFGMGDVQPEIVGSIQVTIRKPFWASAWFWGICLVLVFLAILATVLARNKLLARKQRQQLQQLELENNMNQSMLAALRAQMNPHFFFNALNTIQSYIYANEKKQAADYLAKFSQLTRMVLDMSARETVTLAEEIQSLQLYLELEKGRFEENFEFKLEVMPELDREHALLPSMIVQPLCENAIKHGLLHRKGERRLLVRFSKAQGNLIVMVDDNGIGRKQSTELNRIRNAKHRSFATTATAKRIELLNRAQHNIQVEYIDKMSEVGTAEGTTVILTIAMQKGESQ